MEVDLSNLSRYFEQVWLSALKDQYDQYFANEYTDPSANRGYFLSPGNYALRNDTVLSPEISDYFFRLLYAPNIALLDYLVRDLDRFKSLTFLDNGAGTGLLSVFLKKLGINCHNYDDFSQITPNCRFSEFIASKMRVVIEPVVNRLPISADVLTSSGIWVDNPGYQSIDFKYMMVDPKYNLEQGLIPEISKRFELVDKYPGILRIYTTALKV